MEPKHRAMGANMKAKKSPQGNEIAFGVSTEVFMVAENMPNKAINLSTGEIRDISEFKPTKCWDKVYLRPSILKILILILSLSCFSAHAAFYVTWPDLWNFGTTNASGSGTNIVGGTPVVATNSPNLIWTNSPKSYRSFWITNANFTMQNIGLPSTNNFSASIVISNSGASSINATLPMNCYSISAATNVTAASVVAGTALELIFLYNGVNMTYVEDRGQNSPQLLSIASSVLNSNGVLTAQSGQVNVITNVTMWNVTAQNTIFNNNMQTLNGTSVGWQMAAADALGTINFGLQDRIGTNGMIIEDTAHDFVDVVQLANSGNSISSRFIHSSLLNAANTSGELQHFINGNTAGTMDALGGAVYTLNVPASLTNGIGSGATNSLPFTSTGLTNNTLVNIRIPKLVGAGLVLSNINTKWYEPLGSTTNGFCILQPGEMIYGTSITASNRAF